MIQNVMNAALWALAFMVVFTLIGEFVFVFLWYLIIREVVEHVLKDE